MALSFAVLIVTPPTRLSLFCEKSKSKETGLLPEISPPFAGDNATTPPSFVISEFKSPCTEVTDESHFTFTALAGTPTSNVEHTASI